MSKIADQYIMDDEIYVAYKGGHKEYIFATEKRVYIYKTGFMTGRTFGYSLFQLEHENISSIQIHTQFGGVGYLEVVGVGMQNRGDLSYWSTNKDNDPMHLENTISIAGHIPAYEKLVSELNKVIHNNRSRPSSSQTTDSFNKFDEIKQYKELLDLGIITPEEFNKKKDQLLNS